MARYGKITADDIEQKKKYLQEPLETSQPINVFFGIIDDWVQYSSGENTPLSPAQVLKRVYCDMISSGICKDVCKDCCRKHSAEKIWANFKNNFALEYNNLG